MHKQTTNDITYFQFTTFPTDGVTQAVFGRHGGVSPAPFASLNLSSAVKDEPANFWENRQRAYGVFGRAYNELVHARLVHKADVAVVTQANHGQIMDDVDAYITNDVGCGLTMNYADCAPIFVYDPVQHAIGLGHAGWMGTVADVPGAMVRAMQKAYGSDPADLRGGVGPCISAAVYEVGENVITAVREAFPEQADHLLIAQPNGPRPHFDLPEANRLNFLRAGVHQVEQSGYCTGQRTDLFFSHRAEKGRTGRFGAIFILEARD